MTATWSPGAPSSFNETWAYTNGAGETQKWADAVGGVLPASPAAGNAQQDNRFYFVGNVDSSEVVTNYTWTDYMTQDYNANSGEAVPVDTTNNDVHITAPSVPGKDAYFRVCNLTPGTETNHCYVLDQDGNQLDDIPAPQSLDYSYTGQEWVHT